MTGVDITEDNGLPISGKKFEVDNTNKLADSETNSNSITDGNNASFASTNFGYIVIDGTKCYIQPEFVDAAGDGITDSYHLYYKYDGVKYYVVFFDESENGPALTNDLTYMYYKPKDSAKKYVVRFDSAGAPYYVANTTYKDIKYFSLKVAIFNDKTFNESVASIEDKKTCVRDGASNGYDKYEAMGSPTFVPQITRQFTVYAHWEIKDDFYVSYTNGNSGQDEIIEGEPTGNVYKSNISNQGLAGFYASYLNGSSTPILKTDNKVSAGGNSYLMGYDIDTIRHNYKTYDDFGFDVIPFLNGRFISEVAIEFDRLEAVATSNVTTAHQKVKYKLTISFEWVNNSAIEENIVKVTEIKLWRFDPTLSPVKYCPHCMDDREDAEIVSGKCATCNNEVIERQVGDYNTMADLIVKLDTNSQVVSIKTDDENTQDLYAYLSVLSHISFSGGMTLFDISDYGTDAGGSNVLTMRDGTAFNRRDVNMLRFNFTDLLSSVYVTCKFSVQTYDLKVNHLFDENGDTLIQSTTDRSSYTSQYTEILKDEHYESKDSLES
ncbi:MAG: hypothetical protein IJA23_04850, partial [Clostridia bacterium]|nr:hypothetical protein [Clostridia bacterium]